jgi:hypothetical protein
VALDPPPEKQGYSYPFGNIERDGRESSAILHGHRAPEIDQDRSGKRVGLPKLQEVDGSKCQMSKLKVQMNPNFQNPTYPKRHHFYPDRHSGLDPESSFSLD